MHVRNNREEEICATTEDVDAVVYSDAYTEGRSAVLYI